MKGVEVWQHRDVTLYRGDCLEVLPTLAPDAAACTITDPPYGDTALEWDSRVKGWMDVLPTPVLWCFGSLRFFLGERFDGWSLAQDVIWEKHNGSNFHNDRFRRVHETIAMFYRGSWADVYKAPQFTLDATKKTVRRKQRPPHMGQIGAGPYESIDGGPRHMRSVMRVRSCHGHAEHPTQKPVELIEPLIRYSAPEGATVLDCFAGSGSTMVACVRTGRRGIGIEMNAEHFETAKARVLRAYDAEALFTGRGVEEVPLPLAGSDRGRSPLSQ